MLVLRKYQLDIIFLFFAMAAIIWSVFSFLKYFGVDPHIYEWYVTAPLLALYVMELWKIRQKIDQHDVRNMTSKTLAYWVALGVVLFASYTTPLPATDYWSIELMFTIFTICLADSYWDFRRLTLKSIFKR